MSFPNLEEIVTANPDINLIYIYICSKNPNDDKIVDLKWKTEPKALSFMGNPVYQRLMVYHCSDLLYSYDLSNDAQKVVKRQVFYTNTINNLYVIGYKEDTVPVHQFPAINQVIKTPVSRVTYRVNNRITITNEDKTVYITYSHSPNVDIKKQQFDLQSCLIKFTKPVQ